MILHNFNRSGTAPILLPNVFRKKQVGNLSPFLSVKSKEEMTGIEVISALSAPSPAGSILYNFFFYHILGGVRFFAIS